MRIRRKVQILKRMAGSNVFEKGQGFYIDTESGIWVKNLEIFQKASGNYLKSEFKDLIYKDVSEVFTNKDGESVKINYTENGIDHMAVCSFDKLTLEEIKEHNSGYNPEEVKSHFEGNLVFKENSIDIEGTSSLMLLETTNEYDTISKYMHQITYTHEGKFYAFSEALNYGEYLEAAGFGK